MGVVVRGDVTSWFLPAALRAAVFYVKTQNLRIYSASLHNRQSERETFKDGELSGKSKAQKKDAVRDSSLKS